MANEEEAIKESLKQPSEGEEDPAETVEAPDGGWGWLVVFSAFVFNVVTDGTAYSFGVLFTHLVDYFGTSRSKTAWIGSVFNSAPLLCGPIASLVTKQIWFPQSGHLWRHYYGNRVLRKCFRAIGGSFMCNLRRRCRIWNLYSLLGIKRYCCNIF